jgi:hypothetical protein
MPLDNSLNNGIQASMSLHCAIMSHLADTDPRKFTISTPKGIQSVIRRIYNPITGNVPSSRRIIQDCNKALRAFYTVFQHGGKRVPDLANRMGHRNVAAGRNGEGWGGMRVKHVLSAEVGRWLHDDAAIVKSERTAEILERCCQCQEICDNSSSESSQD